MLSCVCVGVASRSSCGGVSDAYVAPGYCAEVLVEGLGDPRGLVFDPRDGGILVVERDRARILHVAIDEFGAVERSVEIASASGLNHGIALRGDALYASSDTTVYRWAYGTPGAAAGDRRAVVTGISADGSGGAPGGHTTRTLAMDAAGAMFVSVGSAGNVDEDSYRSRVRDCGDLGEVIDPVPFDECAVFADGLRNEVGLAFDGRGRLWGVENSADNLMRDDLGGDIHNDNPADELNLLVRGDSYGYPFCWTAGPGAEFSEAGEQFAWPSTMEEKDDAWCRENSRAPALALQAHSAPLGLAFDADGNAMVAYHGSWNRDVPTGYKVVVVHFDDDGAPTGEVTDVFAHGGAGAKWRVRPVDVVFDSGGRAIVSDDGAGTILAITRTSATSPPTPAPTPPTAPTPPKGESDASRKTAASALLAAAAAAAMLVA